jgi:catechol 2,3-dioxygenase
MTTLAPRDAPSTPRLPAQTRVGGVVLQVSNLERSLTYYREAIGLRPLQVTDDTAALGVTGSESPLVTLRGVAGTRPARRRGAFGLFHFAILLPDRGSLGRFVAHLSSSGIPAGMSDHEVSEAIYLSDPDGLGIEVYADRPRAAWHYTGGQLVMTTDALDVEDLLRAGAGAVWEGVPTGTTMGHVHLHVGDLGVAATFYQHQLGFDLTVWNYPGALFFAAGGYHHLGTNTWAPGPGPGADEVRLLEWTIAVPTVSDAHRVGERLLASGARARRDGDDWVALDPWGTQVRVTGTR